MMMMIYTQLNNQTVQFQAIRFRVSQQVKWFQVELCITNDSIKYQSFIYTQLDNETVQFQTILFRISHLFVVSLNVKQFYLTFRSDPIRCYHFGSELTWEWW